MNYLEYYVKMGFIIITLYIQEFLLNTNVHVTYCIIEKQVFDTFPCAMQKVIFSVLLDVYWIAKTAISVWTHSFID